jgi:hypothetical protein
MRNSLRVFGISFMIFNAVILFLADGHLKYHGVAQKALILIGFVMAMLSMIKEHK